MPDFPPPQPLPSVQVRLRARLEELLSDDLRAVPYEHRDRFWESDDGRQAEFAWTTVATSQGGDRTVTVGYDLLDDVVFVAVDLPGRRWWRRGGSTWRQWNDLDDPRQVVNEVMAWVAQLIEG